LPDEGDLIGVWDIGLIPCRELVAGIGEGIELGIKPPGMLLGMLLGMLFGMLFGMGEEEGMVLGIELGAPGMGLAMLGGPPNMLGAMFGF